MTMVHRSAGLPAAQPSPPAGAGAIQPLTRLHDVARLRPDRSAAQACIAAPALPEIGAAFSALARGSLVATPSGPVAVEDLRPGDLVTTAEAGAEPLVWIGSITLFPKVPPRQPVAARLRRGWCACWPTPSGRAARPATSCSAPGPRWRPAPGRATPRSWRRP